MNVVETNGLGKRYGRSWALRDCTLAIPSGHVVALIGQNGAGKTTLLHQAVGLSSPTAGSISVLDGLTPGSADALERIGFVAQDAALYGGLSVADTLRLTRDLNRRWDEQWARRRMRELDIPLERKVGRLSGGQHAQVALTAALAKRPELLVLDEPVARLDPLARHEFLAALMAAVADEEMSVVFSSHVVAELERVCDYLVVLSAGNIQIAGEVDDVLATHRMLIGPSAEAPAVLGRLPVVRTHLAGRQAHLLARTNGNSAAILPRGWEAHTLGLEELVLAYMRQPEAHAFPAQAPDDTSLWEVRA